MADELKIYRLDYTYFQLMWAECPRDNKRYYVIARTESEAFLKGDKLFGSISGQHRTLLEGAGEVYDNGDLKGYGKLSNFKKSIKEYPLMVVSAPKLSGSDAHEFDLEARVASNSGNAVVVKFVPRKK